MNEKQSDQKKQEEAQVEAAQAAAQALDETLGAGTAWTLSGDIDKAVGHAEMHTGQVVDDPRMVAEGVGLQAYSTAEHIEGKMEHDYAAAQAEIGKAITSLKAEFETLNAEAAHARGEAKADIQAKMDAAKAKQHEIELRIKAALDQAQAETDAKVASLQQQSAQAKGEAKAAIEDDIAQIEYDNQQYTQYLNKALAENSVALSR